MKNIYVTQFKSDIHFEKQILCPFRCRFYNSCRMHAFKKIYKPYNYVRLNRSKKIRIGFQVVITMFVMNIYNNMDRTT